MITLVRAADAPSGHSTLNTLKRFSRLDMRCVAVLLVTGIVNARIAQLDSPRPEFILLVK